MIATNDAEMSLSVVLLLAAVQGVAEFLPISSSGHLALLADLCGQPLQSLELTVALHLGSLVAIAVYYHRRIVKLVVRDRLALWWLVLGTLPAVCIGLPLKLWGEGMLGDPLVAACFLPITGGVLIWTRYIQRGDLDYTDMGWLAALRVGIWQAAAILPGLSRSGLTIAGGLREGLSPAAAAAFSFLLALPAIVGAGVLEAVTAWKRGGVQMDAVKLVAGAGVSCLVGLVALAVLDRSLRRGKLAWYAVWCIAVASFYLGWRWYRVG